MSTIEAAKAEILVPAMVCSAASFDDVATVAAWLDDTEGETEGEDGEVTGFLYSQRTFVHEVTSEDENVAAKAILELIQQRLELVAASMYVTHDDHAPANRD